MFFSHKKKLPTEVIYTPTCLWFPTKLRLFFPFQFRSVSTQTHGWTYNVGAILIISWCCHILLYQKISIPLPTVHRCFWFHRRDYGRIFTGVSIDEHYSLLSCEFPLKGVLQWMWSRRLDIDNSKKLFMVCNVLPFLLHSMTGMVQAISRRTLAFENLKAVSQSFTDFLQVLRGFI